MDMPERIATALRYYTSHQRNFPWRWFGDVPKLGATHNYLCRLLSSFILPENKQYATGNVTLSNLNEKIQHDKQFKVDYVLGGIVHYCLPLEDLERWERNDTEEEVFAYLRHHQGFIGLLKEKIRKDLQYKD